MRPVAPSPRLDRLHALLLHFAALAVMALSALLALPAATLAAPPVFETIVLDELFVDDFWVDACGFAVQQRIEGSIKVSGHRNEAGQLVPEIERFRLTHTLIGPGGTLTTPDRGVNLYQTFNPDGTVAFTATGVIERLVVPDYGLVHANVGQVEVAATFDPATFEILTEEAVWKAGPEPDDFDADDLAAVCGALAD